MSIACFDDDFCTFDVCDPVMACIYTEIEDCGGGPGDAGAVGPDASAFSRARLGGGGCGCESGAGGDGAFIAFLVLLLLLRRRMAATTIALLVVIGAASPASAQGFEAQTFRPHPTTSTFLSLSDGRVLDHMEVHASATYDLADNVLVLRDIDSDEVIEGGEIVTRRQVLHAGVALGIGDRFDVGLGIPIVLAQDGDLSQVAPGQELGAAAGDLRLHARVRLVSTGSVDLAGETVFHVPSGSEDDFAGDGTVALTPRLALGLNLGPARLGLQSGYRIRDKMSVGGLTVGDEITYGAGLAIAVMPGRVWGLAEVSGAAGLQGETVAEEMPVEGLLGFQVRASKHWVVTGGSGAGLTAGYGAPKVRGVVGLAFRPARKAKKDPEPFPIDLEKEEPATPPPAPPADSDGDGYVDPKDECPQEPEDFDEFEDEDGCPEPDNDGDEILDVDDSCPLEAEVVNGIEDEDGCPDEGLIVMVKDRIVLEERVLFDVQRARVKRAGRPVLQAIIDLFNQHPEWESIIIEGHADKSGSAETNQRLSERRAERVKVQMIKQGMAAEKLDAQGLGESKPRVDGDDEEARKKNRRVEFVIIHHREELKVIRPGEGPSGGGESADPESDTPSESDAPAPESD